MNIFGVIHVRDFSWYEEVWSFTISAAEVPYHQGHDTRGEEEGQPEGRSLRWQGRSWLCVFPNSL